MLALVSVYARARVAVGERRAEGKRLVGGAVAAEWL